MKTTEKAGNRLKIWEIALLLGVAVCLLSGAKALHTQDELADKVVRLHVLANSDSEEDQALKLQVRDAVLDRAEDLLAQSSSRAEAEAKLRGQLLEFERLAEAVVREAGYDYEVTAELTDTEFPTREYEGFTLPAGEYLALRILIGEAAGRNWWCVVFPPLCTAATADVPASAMAAGFTEDEVRLITEEDRGYVLKFKAVEFWETLREKWN
ncbi:stage II sporulation protein R [Oscillibacter valericigenes]|uniref:stage II sporulation protein R n=1 Tax=Oscillibacter valericigenes TaxID=351091 RepID=UPI001F2904A6|nr:stage II sporulation protein R [Oscillibacter valericigenes]MCF2664233.1 stage II sporulation protein R [Oscillibacter valericigenes]